MKEARTSDAPILDNVDAIDDMRGHTDIAACGIHITEARCSEYGCVDQLGLSTIQRWYAARSKATASRTNASRCRVRLKKTSLGVSQQAVSKIPGLNAVRVEEPIHVSTHVKPCTGVGGGQLA